LEENEKIQKVRGEVENATHFPRNGHAL